MSKVIVNVRFDQNTLDRVEELAKSKKRHKTELIRLIVEDYFEKLDI